MSLVYVLESVNGLLVRLKFKSDRQVVKTEFKYRLNGASI